MLLLGRANCDVPLKTYDDADTPLARLEYVAEIESLFWNQFKVQDFHSLVPTKKWRVKKRNVRQGDVVLIMYTGKSKSAEYKLGRIVSVEVDPDQLVRTCLVRYSLVQNMPKKERASYAGVTIKYIRVAIQRLVIILPQEEQTDINPITEEEAKLAFKETAGQKGDHDHRVLRTVVKDNKSSFVPDLLRYRSDFEDQLEKESQVDQWVDNISVDLKGENKYCKLCAYCTTGPI